MVFAALPVGNQSTARCAPFIACLHDLELRALFHGRPVLGGSCVPARWLVESCLVPEFAQIAPDPRLLLSKDLSATS